MVNMTMLGILTGLNLMNKTTERADYIASSISLAVFTAEFVLKVITEGFQPLRYFTDPEHRLFNCTDFALLVASYLVVVLGRATTGTTLGALRMVRLILRNMRILTFVKYVPELRAVTAGLFDGFEAVFYIVLLLNLVVYFFAVLGVGVFHKVDPQRFGTVRIAMVTLFQISTLSNWYEIH
jgi:hypothetical protein